MLIPLLKLALAFLCGGVCGWLFVIHLASYNVKRMLENELDDMKDNYGRIRIGALSRVLKMLDGMLP